MACLRQHLVLMSSLLCVAFALVTASCGGGSGGAGPDGAGQGLALLNFAQGTQDNVPITTVLEFQFSEAVDADTINPASIQVRAGPGYGVTASGDFEIDGASVRFCPRLPGECGYGDSGLRPETSYRVMVVGNPEQFCVRNTHGQPLRQTLTYEFHTLPESDPSMLTDQIPGAMPDVIETTPAHCASAVAVGDDNGVVVRFTENIDPCSLQENTTVVFRAYQKGDANVFLDATDGRKSGFDPVEDSDPSDTRWGGNAVDLAAPWRVPATLTLEQTFSDTVLRVRPRVGKFPENCLLVLQLTSGIQDFGGNPMPLKTICFTTENVPEFIDQFAVEFDDTTPVDPGNTTADVNSSRSPGFAQGWLSFGGDGDNGPAPADIPSFPTLNPSNYTIVSCDTRLNDGTKDDFDPESDTTLFTGSVRNSTSCTNESDGSNAVVFEFANFRIRSGVTVTIEGVNPAIILVNGDVDIESGGALVVAGGRGGNGISGCGPGGKAGVPGPGAGAGGTGGYQFGTPTATAYGQDGESGYGSDDPFDRPGTGGGEGGVNAYDPPGWGGSGAGGGGAGHADVGLDGEALLSGNGSFAWAATPVKGAGGMAYPDDDRLLTPTAGSGGGGGGCDVWGSWQTTSCDSTTATGGGGGGGGGFVCITADGDITIAGEINADGGRGGDGGQYTYCGAGGGGGGSGGAIRLLTPANINLSGGTVTAVGGAGGAGTIGTYGAGGGTINTPYYGNDGGDGSHGRIVLEDGDGLIDGLGSAVLVPANGELGYYTAQLDAGRFLKGGTSAVATTEPMAIGPIVAPGDVALLPLESRDFAAGIPVGSDNGPGSLAMVVEVQSFLDTPDAEIDMSSATGWYTVGYFTSSGVDNAPNWVPDAVPTGWVPDAGVGLSGLDGRTVFVQIRVTFYMNENMGIADPGPYIDRMRIRFRADN